MAETEELLNPIISCIEWTFKASEPRHSAADKPPEYTVVDDGYGGGGSGDLEWRKAHSTLALSCITCVGNLVAANSKTRLIVWPHFKLMLE